jgi:hypothetical protein
MLLIFIVIIRSFGNIFEDLRVGWKGRDKTMAEPRERREFTVKGNVHGLFRMRTVDGTSRD